jgi:hypothetical protein
LNYIFPESGKKFFEFPEAWNFYRENKNSGYILVISGNFYKEFKKFFPEKRNFYSEIP